MGRIYRYPILERFKLKESFKTILCYERISIAINVNDIWQSRKLYDFILYVKEYFIHKRERSSLFKGIEVFNNKTCPNMMISEYYYIRKQSSFDNRDNVYINKKLSNNG